MKKICVLEGMKKKKMAALFIKKNYIFQIVVFNVLSLRLYLPQISNGASNSKTQFY